MTFLELKDEVQGNLIDTPSVIQALVGTYINRSLRRIQRLHNFSVMSMASTYVTVADIATIDDVPDDWKEQRGNPRILGTTEMDKEIDWVITTTDARRAISSAYTGEPQAILLSRMGDLGAYSFLSYPTPDDEYSIRISYWRYLPELVDDEDEHWFTIHGDEYLTQRATYYGFVANEDERRAEFWKQMAMESQSELVLTDKKAALAFSETLVPYRGAMAPRFRRT